MERLSFDYYETNDKYKNALVVMLHGYGGCGQNFNYIAKYWCEHLFRNTIVICPNAPYEFEGNCGEKKSLARQWFSLMDRSIPALLCAVKDIAPTVSHFIHTKREEYGIPMGNVVLCGFSQGCMLSLELGLYNSDLRLAGIVGYSGMLLYRGDAVINRDNTKNIMLAHGARDDVIPLSAHYASVDWLKNNQIVVQSHVDELLDHSINDSLMRVGGKFIAQVTADFARA